MKTQAASKSSGKKVIEADVVSDMNENWDSDSGESPDYDERWLSMAAREKERSRIQRQMHARRELERRREEKRLRELVEDWRFDD